MRMLRILFRIIKFFTISFLGGIAWCIITNKLYEKIIYKVTEKEGRVYYDIKRKMNIIQFFNFGFFVVAIILLSNTHF